MTDITYVRTWQGWLYLAVVMDLYSRRVVGWSTKPTLEQDLILDAVLMAVRRRRPKKTLIHSDQGSQYGSDAWRRFCRDHRLEPQHETAWQLLGQRGGGILLQQPEERADQETNLQNA